MGDASINISAQLWPEARRGTDGEKLNLDSELSFEHPLQAPEKATRGVAGHFRVRDLPALSFVTCGATPGWSTGISVSNTTADANIFGAFDETNEQNGSVVLYGFRQTGSCLKSRTKRRSRRSRPSSIRSLTT